MKKQFFAIAGIAAMAFSAFAGIAAFNAVEAQQAQKPPIILVVDRALLVSQSKAGKTIPAQAEKVQASVSKELQAEAKKLNSDIEKFQKNASLMSDEVRAQTEQELAMRQQRGLPQQAQIMEQAYVAAIQNAQNKILVESQPLLKDILDKRGATILLDRSTVMYASTDIDITQEVLSALDKKMSSVEVQKISLADIKKKLQEAQNAQKKK